MSRFAPLLLSACTAASDVTDVAYGVSGTATDTVSDVHSETAGPAPTDDTASAVEWVDDSDFALDIMSAQRLASGLEPLVLDAELSAGCAAHVDYMVGQGRVIREEDPAEPGYSLAGAAAGKNGLLAGNMPRTSDAARAWTASLFHRVLWLEPGVTRVGLAFRDGYACLDVLSAWTLMERFQPVLYPGRDQQDVPAEFSPVTGLNPLPPDLEPPTGVVVSLLFPPEAALGANFAATLTRADCAECAPLAARLRVPLDPNDPYVEYQRNAVAVIPEAPLSAATSYEVVITGLVDAVETTRSWRFTTAVAPAARP